MSDRPEDSAKNDLADADRDAEISAMVARGYTFREAAVRVGAGLGGDGGLSGPTGVREPRWPHPSADSGSATREPPDQPKH